MKKCFACAEEIKEEAHKCKHCGELQPTKENIQNQRTNSLIRWFWIIVIILGAGWFYMYLWETNPIWRAMWS